MKKKKHTLPYHLMLMPGMVFLLIFSIVPMFGAVIAFQKFEPVKGILGSQFVGLANFKRLFLIPDSKQIIFNTVYIAVFKMLLNIIVPLFFAVVLNECRRKIFKRCVQTIVYLPNFLSWVIVAVMLGNMFGPNGFINSILGMFGHEPILFLASNTWFRPLIIGSDVWKGFGYGAIVYLAAIMNIDTSLYEAADIDGASRMQKITKITVPLIMPTVILMATLSLGNVLNAGFDQIFNLYSPLVYETGDIIDTYVYRMGLVQLQYSFGTAVGLLKSVVSFVLIVLSYKLADRFAGYRIF
ncbi:ABC transporter permease [Murimonas intestini]|uniref:ABC transporter permease n=1 Tax=Murimonas intestini TaxID=1337051 RepID=UPI0011DD69AA|nr:ABC transporter permease subunit [Murimonas intestini]